MSAIPGVNGPITIRSKEVTLSELFVTILYFICLVIVSAPSDGWLYLLAIVAVWANTIISILGMGPVVAILYSDNGTRVLDTLAKAGTIPALIRARIPMIAISTFTVYCLISGEHYILTVLSIALYYISVKVWGDVEDRINEHNESIKKVNNNTLE